MRLGFCQATSAASQVLADIAKQGFAIISGGVNLGSGKAEHMPARPQGPACMPTVL